MSAVPSNNAKEFRVYLAISSHGFGHAAQAVPVVNELLLLKKKVRVMIRTIVPRKFFEDRLHAPFEHESVPMDVGCVQSSPVQVDVETTFAKHDEFHATWEERVAREEEVVRAFDPDLVLSAHSYLAMVVGRRCGVPTSILVGFTWDGALEVYARTPKQLATVQFIRKQYAIADYPIRLSPSPEIDIFQKPMIQVEPIAEPPAKSRRADLAADIMAGGRKIVLIAFGGIEADARIDWETVAASLASQYVFIVQSPLLESKVPEHLGYAFVRGRTLAADYEFKELMASSDIIISKPGYGSVMELVRLGKPLVYIRRGDFVDEQAILDYLHESGKGIEISMARFLSGGWGPTLRSGLQLPPPAQIPSLNGARQAAEYLHKMVK